MSNKTIINFNGKDYIATYNKDSGYYELEVQAPDTGGVYDTVIKFTDLLEETYEKRRKYKY